MNMKNYTSYADLVSIGNASFGFLSILMVVNGNLTFSAIFMLIAVIFRFTGWLGCKEDKKE